MSIDCEDAKSIAGAGCVMAFFLAIPAGVLAGLIYAIVWIVRHA